MKKLLATLSLALTLSAGSVLAYNAPPVRIAIIPGGGSGIEQEIVDRISSALSNNSSVSVSTVNPDWMVTCNVVERQDQASGQVRYNGNVTVKTRDGHVISTIAVQKYNQDFSLQPGTPINKALVDGATKEVIQGASERALPAIEQAVETEMQTRDHIISAEQLAQADKYDEGLQALGQVVPDSPHFRSVQDLIAKFEMEKKALESVRKADGLAKQGKLQSAINEYKQVPTQSKRRSYAGGRIASLRAQLLRLAKNKQQTVHQ